MQPLLFLFVLLTSADALLRENEISISEPIGTTAATAVTLLNMVVSSTKASTSVTSTSATSTTLARATSSFTSTAVGTTKATSALSSSLAESATTAATTASVTTASSASAASRSSTAATTSRHVPTTHNSTRSPDQFSESAMYLCYQELDYGPTMPNRLQTSAAVKQWAFWLRHRRSSVSGDDNFEVMGGEYHQASGTVSGVLLLDYVPVGLPGKGLAVTQAMELLRLRMDLHCSSDVYMADFESLSTLTTFGQQKYVSGAITCFSPLSTDSSAPSANKLATSWIMPPSDTNNGSLDVMLLVNIVFANQSTSEPAVGARVMARIAYQDSTSLYFAEKVHLQLAKFWCSRTRNVAMVGEADTFSSPQFICNEPQLLDTAQPCRWICLEGEEDHRPGAPGDNLVTVSVGWKMSLPDFTFYVQTNSTRFLPHSMVTAGYPPNFKFLYESQSQMYDLVVRTLRLHCGQYAQVPIACYPSCASNGIVPAPPPPPPPKKQEDAFAASSWR